MRKGFISMRAFEQKAWQVCERTADRAGIFDTKCLEALRAFAYAAAEEGFARAYNYFAKAPEQGDVLNYHCAQKKKNPASPLLPSLSGGVALFGTSAFPSFDNALDRGGSEDETKRIPYTRHNDISVSEVLQNQCTQLFDLHPDAEDLLRVLNGGVVDPANLAIQIENALLRDEIPGPSLEEPAAGCALEAGREDFPGEVTLDNSSSRNLESE